MKERLVGFTRTRLPEVTRYILIGLVITIISFLFPQDSMFNYHFEKNGLWRYQDLVAPFDFAILKPVNEYEQEVNELKSNLYPFYIKDTTIVFNQKNAFSNEFLTKLRESDIEDNLGHVRSNPDLYRQEGLKYLDEVYKRGVVKLEKQHTVNDNTLINIIIRPGEIYRSTTRGLTAEAVVKAEIVDSLKNIKQLENPLFLEEVLKNNIIPDITYNDSLSKLYHDLEISKIVNSKGKVNERDIVVRRGETIDPHTYQKLLSLQKLSKTIENNKNDFLIKGGYLLLTILLVSIFVLFFAIYHPPIFWDIRQLSFMLMWLVLYSYLVYSVKEIGFLNSYLIPFCIVPIIVKNFYNQQIALFVHVLVVLLAGFLAAQNYEFLVAQVMAGVVVMLAKVRVRDWSSFFYSMIYVWLTYTTVFIALALRNEGSFETINLEPLAWISVNILLTLLAFPLIPLLERIFGYTSELTLMELGSLDKPLLKKLSLTSPGTLQHSLQVGNLAEAAAFAIGANALLVKVAAYYHDIGKMKNPFYFIENQGKQSPHDNLTSIQSASIILEHVTEGIRIAKHEGLPKVIIDFIETHHGTTKVEYFYRKHLAANPDGDKDESKFTYTGRLPKTKEEAILMIADSIEAASKSLKILDEATIDNLVENIIAGKIQNKQLDNSNLTFEELVIIKAVFKKQLKSIYHIRIPYPERK
jgi:cyclic-di-AMP phosphodiesterase PgpH